MCSCQFVMKRNPVRVRTRDELDTIVHLRVNREMKKQVIHAARETGAVVADIYRAAFSWLLECFHAAGGRVLSDLEERAALDSIKKVSMRLHEAAGEYNAKPATQSPSKRARGAA